MNKRMPNLKKIKLLPHDNAKPRNTYIVREFLENGKTEVLAHPVYSPDFAHAIFGFPITTISGKKKKKKHSLRGIHCFFSLHDGRGKFTSDWIESIQINSSVISVGY